MNTLKYKWIESPVGLLKIIAKDRALIAILWDNDKIGRVNLDEMIEDKNDPFLKEVENQLNDYFSKKRKIFDLSMETFGTPFQKDVWKMLSKIPYGVTCTYKDIAEKIGRPKAVRAVGTAIGRNPISIIIPCHRVIASDGTLAGFAGGLGRKRILLDLES